MAGELHGVVDVGFDFAEDLSALRESYGAEVGAEGGEKLLDLLLVGRKCGVHWRTSSGWRMGWMSWSRPLEKSTQAAAMRRRRSRPSLVSA